MTSTRVIRGFKVDTTKADNRPTVLPTPQKLTADIGNFQDIGAKIVRPKSRKAISHLARKTGLRTSEGLAQQLVKEEGIKIRIGDKTLKELLQVEVPETRKQEYIKDDGSIGVRKVPVLDSKGNPILVKKNLTIPGSIEYFQKSIKEKLDELEQVLKDQTKSASEKSDILAVLIISMMGSSPPPSGDDAKSMFEFADHVSMSEDPIVTGLPVDGLDEGRFVSPLYLQDNQDAVRLYLMKFAVKRGLPRGNLLYDIRGNPLADRQLAANLFDSAGNLRTVDLLTSRILPSAFESIEAPSVEFKEFEKEEEEEPFISVGLSSETRQVADLINRLTQEQRKDIDPATFNKMSELKKETFLKAVFASVEEFEEEEIPIKEDPFKTKQTVKDMGLNPTELTKVERGLININEYNKASVPEQINIITNLQGKEDRLTIEKLNLNIDEDILRKIQKDIVLPSLLTLNQSEISEIKDIIEKPPAGFPLSKDVDDILSKIGKPVGIVSLATSAPSLKNTMLKILEELPIEEQVPRQRREEQGEDPIPSPQIVQQFVGSLDEDEQKTFSEIINKGLNQLPIKMDPKSFNLLTGFVTGKTGLRRSSPTLDTALGFSFNRLSFDEKIIIKKLQKANLIISQSGSGRRHYEIAHVGAQYGYVRQKNIMCC